VLSWVTWVRQKHTESAVVIGTPASSQQATTDLLDLKHDFLAEDDDDGGGRDVGQPGPQWS